VQAASTPAKVFAVFATTIAPTVAVTVLTSELHFDAPSFQVGATIENPATKIAVCALGGAVLG